MKLLESINGPEDLKALPADQMPLLAEEIRAFLVDSADTWVPTWEWSS